MNKKPTIAEKRLSSKRPSEKNPEENKSIEKKPISKKPFENSSDSDNEQSRKSRTTEPVESTAPDTEIHGEDEHFIPEEGNAPPVTPEKARIVENIFHHREEVALKQENNKARLATSSRKNLKRTYRMRGGR